MKHNNEFALSKVWTVKAFVVESPIVALYFCFCKHVFKGFDWFKTVFNFTMKMQGKQISILILPRILRIYWNSRV